MPKTAMGALHAGEGNGDDLQTRAKARQLVKANANSDVEGKDSEVPVGCASMGPMPCPYTSCDHTYAHLD